MSQTTREKSMTDKCGYCGIERIEHNTENTLGLNFDHTFVDQEDDAIVPKPDDEVTIIVTPFVNQNGPKPIGVVDREFRWLQENGISEQLKMAGDILRGKYGETQFENELGRQLKKDLIMMQTKPGSYVFIADSDVTVAIMNDNNESLLIEVRRPGMPYQRGSLKTRQQLGESLGIKTLLEG